MNTLLFETKDMDGNLLRGVLTEPDAPGSVAVVMMAGFERAATAEKKFKQLADRLAEYGVAALRLDAAGIGLSDGDYSQLSVQGMTSGVMASAQWLRERGYLTVSAACHSLGACVMASAWPQASWKHVVMLAPALNQAALLRYYYVKRERPDLPIVWENFGNYLDEERFRLVMGQGHVTKSHRIASGYFEENWEADYTPILTSYANDVLHVHGTADDKVPLVSVDLEAGERLIIEGADHDLERPGQFEEWFDAAAAWLSA